MLRALIIALTFVASGCATCPRGYGLTPIRPDPAGRPSRTIQGSGGAQCVPLCPPANEMLRYSMGHSGNLEVTCDGPTRIRPYPFSSP